MTRELWPNGYMYDGGFVIWRPCGVSGSNLTVDNIFVMFNCSVFLAAGLAAFQ